MSNKKHILIVAPYVSFPEEMGMNRFIYLSQMLAEKFDVTLVTSNYCHFLKKHREPPPYLDKVNVVLLDEIGYKKNVSIKRIISHHYFCHNFEKFLRNYTKKIDIVYSAYPLIRTNYILGKYKNEKNYKLIIDVQDIWPEAISGAIPFFSTLLGKMLMKPIIQYADKTYSYADALVAVSDTYLKRADVKNLPKELKISVYIGANKIFNKKSTNIKTEKNKLVATYLGTMGGSYDLETIVKAAPLCKDKVQIQFIGTGPHEPFLQKLNSELNGNVSFMGVYPYEAAMELLSQSDVALNALKKSSEQSITNKLSDYICCGLPIVSCQKNPEVEELLSQGGGIQYQPGDYIGLSKALLKLSEDKDVLDNMSRKNLSIAKDKFLREISYKRIENLINKFI